jgi:hypothetical protein
MSGIIDGFYAIARNKERNNRRMPNKTFFPNAFLSKLGAVISAAQRKQRRNTLGWSYQYDPNSYGAPTLTKVTYNISNGGGKSLELRELLDLDALVYALITDEERPQFTVGEIEFLSQSEPIKIADSYPGFFQIGTIKGKAGSTISTVEDTNFNGLLQAACSGSFSYKSLLTFKEETRNFAKDTDTGVGTYESECLYEGSGSISITNLLNEVAKRYDRMEFQDQVANAPESTLVGTLMGKDDGVNHYLTLVRWIKYHMVPRSNNI